MKQQSERGTKKDGVTMRQYNQTLRWTILGTGAIANEMARALLDSGREIHAVGSRTQSKTADFAKRYPIKKVYANYHDMFTDPDTDIIYIATPHNTHFDFMKMALAGGKHVLCEKSITLNSSELNKAMHLAAKNNLVLAEAMTVYHMPLLKKLRGMIAAKALGAVRIIQLNFGSSKPYDMTNRFFNKSLAGGALLDIGVYALSFARYFMASRPQKIHSLAGFAPSGTDEQSGIIMANSTGEMAVISLSLHAKQPKRAVVACEKGYIEIMEYPRAFEAVIVHTETGQKETIRIGETEKALQYEIEDMENAVLNRKDEMMLPLTADVMEMMTAIRKEWGLTYDSECGRIPFS